MRRIGLIGGITWAASADYYRRINLQVQRRLGGRHSADLVLRSLDLDPLLARAGEIAELSAVFSSAGRDLRAAGAELLAVASFTGHRYAGELPRLGLPFVDLLDCVGARLRMARHERIAVWATSYALADESLIARVGESAGARLLPAPPEARERLDRIAFDELAQERLSEASIAWLRALLARHIEAGAGAVLLATTDFSPLAARLQDLLPVLDATAIHCDALLEASLCGSVALEGGS